MRKCNGRPTADRTWNNKNHFSKAQILLRKTGEITIEEGLNQAAMINMVSEGVQAALAEHKPRAEESNNAEETNNPKQQLEEMFQMIEQINAAQQPIKQQPKPMQQ